MAMSNIYKHDTNTRKVHLTPAEIKVLSLIAQGHSSKAVASLLMVSKRTIDFHLANVYDKLQVKNRVQALRAATRLGLIAYDPVFGINEASA